MPTMTNTNPSVAPREEKKARFTFRLIHMNTGWRHFAYDREAGLGGDFINEEGYSSLAEAKRAAKRWATRGSVRWPGHGAAMSAPGDHAPGSLAKMKTVTPCCSYPTTFAKVSDVQPDVRTRRCGQCGTMHVVTFTPVKTPGGLTVWAHDWKPCLGPRRSQ